MFILTPGNGMSTPFFQEMRLAQDEIISFEEYPFHLDVVKNLSCIKFHPAVTYIIGENGSGKSTLLEALAIEAGFNPEGGSKNYFFNTRESHSRLHDFIRVSKGRVKPKDGYFLRAESYYNVATELERLEKDPWGPPVLSYYNDTSPHEQSHGESFMTLFLHRLYGGGLYILDEPEAALSPNRQMSILTRMHELVNLGSQFIIATHSPIIMGYPGAWIYTISSDGIHRTEYEETEHYKSTQYFLNNREKMLEILLSEDIRD